MNQTQRHSIWVFALLTLAMVFAFQNCGPAKLTGGETGSASTTSAPSSLPPSLPNTVISSGPIAIASCTASTSRPDSPCTSAYDQNPDTIWNAGANTGWIEFDLGSEQSISKVTMAVSQSPAGNTSHNVYFDVVPRPGMLLAIFNQFSDSNTVLTWQGPAVTARYIRIETNANPSWAAWKEVQFFH